MITTNVFATKYLRIMRRISRIQLITVVCLSVYTLAFNIALGWQIAPHNALESLLDTAVRFTLWITIGADIVLLTRVAEHYLKALPPHTTSVPRFDNPPPPPPRP